MEREKNIERKEEGVMWQLTVITTQQRSFGEYDTETTYRSETYGALVNLLADLNAYATEPIKGIIEKVKEEKNEHL